MALARWAQLAALLGATCLAGAAAAEPAAPDRPAARAHDAAAKALAGDDPRLLWPYHRFCETGFRIPGPKDAVDAPAKPTDFMTPHGYVRMAAGEAPQTPTQIFDNVYYVGNKFIGSVLVKTTAGLIIIDTMNSGEDVDKIIVPGMRSLGLDLKDLKYIILTHQHADHYGGINRLLEIAPAAQVVAGKPDADELEARKKAGPRGVDGFGRKVDAAAAQRALDLIPQRFDILVTAAPNSPNGVRNLTLGDTTMRMALVPSHTIGMLSLIIPTTWKGQPHVIAMWGGNHIDAPDLPAKAKQYTASLDYFHSLTTLAGADAALHPHVYQDDEATMMDEFRAHPDGPNPFVLGVDGYSRYIEIWTECMRALWQRAQDGTWTRF